MNKQVKKKWLKALRSGEYEQTTNYLKNDGAFCCLGILCDIHSKETKHRWRQEHYFTEMRGLPHQVLKWAGLPDDRYVCYKGKHGQLGNANDMGLSFKQIANIIENQL